MSTATPVSLVVGAAEVDGPRTVAGEAAVERPVNLQPCHREVGPGADLMGIPSDDHPILTVHRHAGGQIVGAAKVDGPRTVASEAGVECPVGLQPRHPKVGEPRLLVDGLSQ